MRPFYKIDENFNRLYENPRVASLIMSDPHSKLVHFQGLHLGLMMSGEIDCQIPDDAQRIEFLARLHDWQIVPLLEYSQDKASKCVNDDNYSRLHHKLCKLVSVEMHQRGLGPLCNDS